MNLRVYRNLYWANQGLINAARAIRELSREQGLPGTKLREIHASIEEARGAMNRLVGEQIDQRGSGRSSRLNLIRFPGRSTRVGMTPEKTISPHG